MKSPVTFFPTDEQYLPITDSMVKDIYPWYQISNFGNVYSFKSNKVLKPGIDTKGYPYVALSTKNGPKNQRIHRLVMLAFDNKDNLARNDIGNHIDGNKLNPNGWNIERTDFSGNMQHAYRTGLIKNSGAKGNISDEDIRRVCELLTTTNLNCKQIAKEVGCSLDTVYSINSGKAHTKISSEYNLKPKTVLSEDQIRNICICFESNPRNKRLKEEYLTEVLNTLGIEVNSSTLSVAERVLYRQSFTNISKGYKF